MLTFKPAFKLSLIFLLVTAFEIAWTLVAFVVEHSFLISDDFDTLFGILRLVITFITVAQAERRDDTETQSGAPARYCQLPAAVVPTGARDSFKTGSEVCDLELDSPHLNRDR